MGAYIVKCNEIVKDDNGEIVEIRCTADLETRNGMPVDGRKVKGTIHWVSAEHAIDADLYLYDNLFTLENVNDVPEGTDYLDYLNPDSLKKLTGCKLEPSLADAKEGEALPVRPHGLLLQGPRDRPLQPYRNPQGQLCKDIKQIKTAAALCRKARSGGFMLYLLYEKEPLEAAASGFLLSVSYSSSCRASKPSAPVRTLMTFSTS